MSNQYNQQSLECDSDDKMQKFYFIANFYVWTTIGCSMTQGHCQCKRCSWKERRVWCPGYSYLLASTCIIFACPDPVIWLLAFVQYVSTLYLLFYVWYYALYKYIFFLLQMPGSFGSKSTLTASYRLFFRYAHPRRVVLDISHDPLHETYRVGHTQFIQISTWSPV